MSSFHTFLSLLKTPKKMFRPLAARGFFDWMPDALFLKWLYYTEMGEPLDLEHPVGFNEKLQWLKLYDRKQEYCSWVDKKEAKTLAAQKIGKQYVVPLLGAWADARDIDFEKLPEKCVLKCSHDQGSTILLDQAKPYQPEELIAYYQKRLKKNAYRATREWPYKHLEPMVICEPYLGKDLIDYKFFCFNGKPTFVNIGQNASEAHQNHITFLDFDWNPLPFQRTDFPRVKQLPLKPANFSEMYALAEKLAEGTAFVRIDLFNIEGQVYFSEFTLYPTSGLIRFEPREYDKWLGGQLNIESVDSL